MSGQEIVCARDCRACCAADRENRRRHSGKRWICAADVIECRHPDISVKGLIYRADRILEISPGDAEERGRAAGYLEDAARILRAACRGRR